ncbi:MAG: FG-GAP-like repeat-containing protein [Thermoplasmata archaeon]
MSLELLKKKSWKDEGGVSEVIGNILILAITVILFSGIIAFVQTMPVPEQTTKADFSASLVFSSNYRHANLTLIHAGGKPLSVNQVLILLTVDNTNYDYRLTDDPSWTGDTWNTGKAWRMQIDGTSSSTVVTATVVDLEKSSMIWTSQVTGGVGGNAPNILQRYIDSDPSTPTPDPVKANDTFTLFVKIEDPDNDLDMSNVWIDASHVAIEGSNGNHRPGTYANGWWTWAFGRVLSAAAVDGSVVEIHAFDIAGHEAVSQYVIEITVLPSDLNEYWYPQYAELGFSGLPAWLSYVSGGLGHGFGIYAELFNRTTGAPTGQADVNSPCVNFTKDSNIFIRFASLTMSNLNGDNRIVITDTRTGSTFAPSYRFNSTATTPFYPYPTGGSAYVYEAVFNTSNLPPSSYTVTLYLKNLPPAGQTQLTFQADKTIVVWRPGASVFIPSMVAYKSDWATPWGTTKDKPFNISSATDSIMYVKIRVQNAQSSPAPTVAEVRLTDYSGGSQLYGVPPAGTVISQLSRYDDVTYSFTIALRLNNGDQWLPGLNAYTLYVTKLSDSNEGVYSLSLQVWIRGTQSKADFVVGTAGMASGQSNFNIREYVWYVQNNNFFTSRVLWKFESTPGNNYDYTTSAMALGDLDGDGDKDLLVAMATSNQLYFFENTLNVFGTWQAGSEISRASPGDGYTYPIVWIATGDFSGDGKEDFAYANSNSQIVLYNSTYGAQPWIFNPPGTKWTGTISKIALEDMTGDGTDDLIVLAGGRLYVYDVKYTYDALLMPYANPNARFAMGTGTGIKDFDIEDMDGDGYLDIVATGTSTAFGSYAGVTVNLYSVTAESAKLLNENAAGFNPRMESGTYSGSVTDAKSSNNIGIVFTETTANGYSRVQGIMRFETLDNKADQVLRVRAKVNPGPSGGSESFYVYVTSDSATNVTAGTCAWNYVGEIDGTDWATYNFTLPTRVMGSQMFVKFEDSLTSEDSTVDSITVDYAFVITKTIGYSEQSVTTATTWTSVRGAEVDGLEGGYKEVVVAKDGANGISIFTRTGTTWGVMAGTGPSADSTFYDDCASKVNDNTKYPFSTLAPTLFDAADINGDGFTDILVCNYTTTSDGLLVSKIGFWMNLYAGGQSWRYYSVKTWTMAQPTGQAKNPYIDIVLAESLIAL